jgi:hypothetical protein
MNLIFNMEAAATHLEVPLQGTLRTRAVNGASNCLNPTKGELKQAEAGELESPAGGTKLSNTTQLPLRVCGVVNEEGLTLGVP